MDVQKMNTWVGGSGTVEYEESGTVSDGRYVCRQSVHQNKKNNGWIYLLAVARDTITHTHIKKRPSKTKKVTTGCSKSVGWCVRQPPACLNSSATMAMCGTTYTARVIRATCKCWKWGTRLLEDTLCYFNGLSCDVLWGTAVGHENSACCNPPYILILPQQIPLKPNG